MYLASRCGIPFLVGGGGGGGGFMRGCGSMWCYLLVSAVAVSKTHSAQPTCALLLVLAGGGADQHMVQLWVQLVWICLGCLGLAPDVKG